MAGLVRAEASFRGLARVFDEPPPEGLLQVEGVAHTARPAVTWGGPGVYNVAEDDGTVSSPKAMEIVGWRPDFSMAHTVD